MKYKKVKSSQKPVIFLQIPLFAVTLLSIFFAWRRCLIFALNNSFIHWKALVFFVLTPRRDIVRGSLRANALSSRRWMCVLRGAKTLPDRAEDPLHPPMEENGRKLETAATSNRNTHLLNTTDARFHFHITFKQKEIYKSFPKTHLTASQS